MQLSLVSFATALAVVVHVLPAQQVIVVDRTGGGQFVSIAPAIAAANAGDFVVVRPGRYAEPALVVDKGIALLADGSVTIDSQTLGQPGLLVHDLPAAESFRMSGFAVIGGFGLGFFTSIRDCDGLVAIERIFAGNVAPAFTVVGSRQVELESVTSNGFSSTDSTTLASGCAFEGGGLFPAIVASGSLTMVGCSVARANGVQFGPGVSMTSGRLTVTESTVRAGRFGEPASAIELSAEAELVMDPTTVLVPWNGAPPISGAGSVSRRQVANLDAESDGSQLQVDLHGIDDSDFVVLMSLPSEVVPTPFGDLWFHPDHLLLEFGFLRQGNRDHVFSVAHGAVQGGFAVTLQAVLLTPNSFVLSAPDTVLFPL